MQALTLLWNPTDGIDLGFFKIQFYSLMFVVAFSLGWYIIKKIYKKEQESARSNKRQEEKERRQSYKRTK